MTPELREKFIYELHIRTRSCMMPFNIYQRERKPGSYDPYNAEHDQQLYEHSSKEAVKGHIFIAKLVDELITELDL